MTTDALAILELLEELLTLTERYKREMTPEDRREWSKISASAADFREEERR